MKWFFEILPKISVGLLMQNKLTVGLKGGMGNQLFQYFAASELSRLNSRKLVIDTSWYRRNVHANGLLSPRQFMLGQYSFSENVTISDDFNWKNSPLTERIFRRTSHQVSLCAGIAFELEQGTKLPRFLSNIYISGHWIKNPILPSRNKLREVLVDNLLRPSSTYLQLRSELRNKKVIAVHIRLGDYLNFQEVYGVTGESYHVDAIKELHRVYPDHSSEIWLFSDDTFTAEKILSQHFKVDRVIDESYGLGEAESIALMSEASAIIGSNSTFSWWAGYLSKSELTKVVMPKQYMRGILMKETGLYISDWLYL